MGETIGATAVIGALLVVGSATVYNVRQAKTRPESVQKGWKKSYKRYKKTKIYEQPVKYLLKRKLLNKKCHAIITSKFRYQMTCAREHRGSCCFFFYVIGTSFLLHFGDARGGDGRYARATRRGGESCRQDS